MQFKPNQPEPVIAPQKPQASALIVSSRFAFWQPRVVQAAPRWDEADQRDLDQRVRESGEW